MQIRHISNERPNEHPDARFETARSDEGGYALLLTIWVLALMSILAAGLAAETGSEGRIAHTRTESAVARQLADAGVAFALEGLLDADLTRRWPADGRQRRVGYAGGAITVEIQDEAGKVDLNAAPIELLAGLTRVLGIDPAAAGTLIAGIVARRQQFPPPAKAGARALAVDPGEPALFAAARLPFASVPEIRLAAVLSRRDYERLMPFLTVYSPGGRINTMTAPLPVLLAIPGILPDQAEAFVAARTALVPGQPAQDLPTMSGVAEFGESGALRTVTITSIATTPATISFEREAVVAMAPERPLDPFTILHWTQASTEAVP